MSHEESRGVERPTGTPEEDIEERVCGWIGEIMEQLEKSFALGEIMRSLNMEVSDSRRMISGVIIEGCSERRS